MTAPMIDASQADRLPNEGSADSLRPLEERELEGVEGGLVFRETGGMKTCPPIRLPWPPFKTGPKL